MPYPPRKTTLGGRLERKSDSRREVVLVRVDQRPASPVACVRGSRDQGPAVCRREVRKGIGAVQHRCEEFVPCTVGSCQPGRHAPGILREEGMARLEVVDGERRVVDGGGHIAQQEIREAKARLVAIDPRALDESLRCLQVEEVIGVAVVLIAGHHAVVPN